MGARPSSFKKGGGGYLNEVDATIVGYTFEAGESVEVKKGPRKGEEFAPLVLIPEFQVDGEDDVKTARLLLGDANGYGDITDNGQVVQTPDGQSISAKCEVGIFIGSLVDGGFPEDLFSDDPDSIDFRPMIGTRVRLVQEVNADKTKRQGKQKGKDGKEYDRRDLKVATVHSLPEAKAAPAKAGKAAPKGKAAKAVSIDAEAAAVLKTILNAAPDNKILKTKLSMAVLRTAKGDNKEAVRTFLFDDDNLAAIEGVDYDAKKGLISLAE